MAHIDTRELKPDKTTGKPRKAYLVRWIDAAGKERAKTYRRMADAKVFKVEIERSLLRGTYIDPRAGDIDFKPYAESWRIGRLDHRPKTAQRVEQDLRCYTYPQIGTLRIGAARKNDLQTWVSALVHTYHLAPITIRGVVATVKSVFGHAVEAGLIARNPCVGLALPEVVKEEVVIPTAEQLREIISTLHSPWYRRLVIAVAGTGLRSGEIRGLTEDRVDWLRRTVKVDRQLADVVDGQPVFAPPKTAAGHRTIPVARCVIDILAEQLAERGAGPECLIFTNQRRGPISRNTLNHALSRALDSLGWPDGTGAHLFRHYYASMLIHKGLNVKVVQKRMGHATAQETLDTYGHLWPDSDEDSRTAVTEVLAPIISEVATSPSTVRQSVKTTSLQPQSSPQIQRQSESGTQLIIGVGS